MRQYVKQTERVSSDSPRGSRDCREEEEITINVVVLVVVELLLGGCIQSSVDVEVCAGSPLRCWVEHELLNSCGQFTLMMTSRTPCSWKSLICPLQSSDVWHMLVVRSVSSLGE